jgi:heptosyltransferase-2
MGPNFPELTASSLEHATIVRVHGLDCAPCLERRCPLQHHACMQRLAVDDVVAAADALLARPRRRA